MTDGKDYPDSPGFKVSGPSEQAAEAIAPRAPRIRDTVLEKIAGAAAPLTADEVAGALGMSVLTVRPRVSELHRMGEIQRASDRRCNSSGMTASTWRAAPPLTKNAKARAGGGRTIKSLELLEASLVTIPCIPARASPARSRQSRLWRLPKPSTAPLWRSPQEANDETRCQKGAAWQRCYRPKG
jgi:hypothetical protein